MQQEFQENAELDSSNIIGVSSCAAASLASQIQSSLQGSNSAAYSSRQSSNMDDFLDNMMTIPAWSEVGALRQHWDFNAMDCTLNPNTSAAKILRNSLQDEHIFSDSEMLLSVTPFHGLSRPDSGRSSSMGHNNNEADDTNVGLALLDDSICTISAASTVIGLPALIGIGSEMLTRSISVGSSGSEGSAGQQNINQNSTSTIAPSWGQQFIGSVSPSLGKTMVKEAPAARESHNLLGKRNRDKEQLQVQPRSSSGQAQDGAPIQIVTAQTSQQPGQSLGSAQTASDKAAASVGVAVGRPRVRARRGQATDPHSIAERLRRERIADRMKALQELVPNANKTDKASMLDEIIDYVKFLQLQVKVLSMSRLGGAGAVAPVVADFPSETAHETVSLMRSNSTVRTETVKEQEGNGLTEHQVSRLMEEDMGAAMQYLQSKGLCLMPISLANAISTTKTSTATATTAKAPTPLLTEVPLE